ncbi:aldehyde dehydrogenase [Trichoderma arundinaceum]|uniref:Aldehyde dehydrogenase n=1 Tax=Trichoderma arundinaceum TaxID=490622 RepID=A0A395NBD8_TRIAR|nr:aldehyde dehydrogenase [Trichoderma arundinaceum]
MVGVVPPGNSTNSLSTLRSTEQDICSVFAAGEHDVDRAVRAARQAFKQSSWRLLSGTERGHLMNRLADLVDKHSETLAAIETLDNGKPLSISRSYDVPHFSEVLRYYAGWADKNPGSVIDVGPKKMAYTVKQPVGVCGQIIPWNYPLDMAAWKLGPALSCGNTVVLKLAEQTPLSMLYVAQLIRDAGFPPGVINIISGHGGEAGAALARHPDVDKIAFTGSTATGKEVMRMAARTLKAVTLETGGKSPLIVFDDANLEQAVRWAHEGVMANQGQVCTATSRLLVQDGIYDSFVERLKAFTEETSVLGDPFDPKTYQGPQVGKAQAERITSYISSARSDGASIFHPREPLPSRGYFIPPTILTDVGTSTAAFREEIFGPVAAIARFSSEEEAIEIANTTRYGLAGAVFTRDLGRAHRVARDLEAGMVWVNSSNDSDVRVPFGGVKESGLGRELGEDGLGGYYSVKAVHVNLTDELFHLQDNRPRWLPEREREHAQFQINSRQLPNCPTASIAAFSPSFFQQTGGEQSQQHYPRSQTLTSSSMALPFPQANIALGYPLYAVGFDPENANRLVVGGGGGAGRSGVANKISVVEVVDQGELRVAGDIDLSRDEDCVMSLAVAGGASDKPSRVFAGINSSPKDISKGKNDHLRSFSVEQTKLRAAGAKNPDVQVAEVSRSAFFTNPDADTYQRLLRISGSIGAAATGLGKESQLAVFDASGPKPKVKGVIELTKDAEDLDILQSVDGEHLLVYCHKHELYLVKVGKKNSEPELIFTMTDDHGELPAFRAVRFVTPSFVIAAANLPKGSGVLLQGFRLPTPSHDKARISAAVRIPKKISATAFAVATLSPPPSSPSASSSIKQSIIAVAGSDASIYLYTMDHKTLASLELLSNLYPLYTLKDAHRDDKITGVEFSNFIPPKQHLTQQFIRLASISLQKGVAVHSIALKRQIDVTPGKPTDGAPVRYVTAMRAKAPSRRPLVITLSIMLLIMAIIGQSIMEIYGVSKPIINAQKYVPSWHGTLRDPTHPPAAFSKEYLISRLAGSGVNTAETLVMWEADHPVVDVEGSTGDKKISLDVHDEEVHGPAKTWEELPAAQKNAWKQRLQKAGAWTQNMGESVFRGILFGELAGAVGHAVAEGLA